MKSKRSIFLVLPIILLLVFYQSTSTTTIAATGNGTSTISVSGAVALNFVDAASLISTETFEGANTASINSETRYIYESINEADATPDTMSINEGTTTVEAYYYINTTAIGTSPSGVTPSVWDFIFYRNATNTDDIATDWNGASGGANGAFMAQNLTTTTVASADVTVTSNSSSLWEATFTFTYLYSADGNVWTSGTYTIYAWGTATYMAIDDDSDFTEATETGHANQTIIDVGDEFDILGNSYVLTSSIPSGASETVELYFGWNADETLNGVESGTTMSFDLLWALPFSTSGTYSATITATGV